MVITDLIFHNILLFNMLLIKFFRGTFFKVTDHIVTGLMSMRHEIAEGGWGHFFRACESVEMEDPLMRNW